MKAIKKFFTAMLTGALCVGALSGCGSSAASSSASSSESPASATSRSVSETVVSGSSAPSTSGKDLNICMIVIHTDEHFKRVMAGAKAYADENGINLDIQSPTSATDYDAQINMLETAIGSGAYDAIAIAPAQSESVAKQVDAASGNGTVFVAFNSDFDSKNKSTFVGTGNEAAAKAGGKAAAEEAIKRGSKAPTAVVLTGVQGDETHEARLKGYTEGVEEAGGKVVDVQYCDSQPDKATTAMEGIMQKYPDGVDVVLCTDDNAGAAAAKAKSDANLEAYKDTVMCGFDGNQAQIENIGKTVDLDVAQLGYEMGYKTIEACVRAINGEKLDSFIDSGYEVVSSDNVQDYISRMKKLGIWNE
jgi:ribose transport system substrate-binding protein